MKLGSNGTNTDTIGEKGPVDEALDALRENFLFSNFHEERVRMLLENDNSLIDDLNHLVISASLMLSDGSQMKAGPLRAHQMGDKIVVEEEEEDGWEVKRTVGMQVAQILAHARANKRVQELEELVSGLGQDQMDRLEEIDKALDGQDPFGSPPKPIDEGVKPPMGPTWVDDKNPNIRYSNHTQSGELKKGNVSETMTTDELKKKVSDDIIKKLKRNCVKHTKI